MGIRERLNKNPAIAIAGAGILIVAIAVEAFVYLAPHKPTLADFSKGSTLANFTTDDGRHGLVSLTLMLARSTTTVGRR